MSTRRSATDLCNSDVNNVPANTVRLEPPIKCVEEVNCCFGERCSSRMHKIIICQPASLVSFLTSPTVQSIHVKN